MVLEFVPVATCYRSKGHTCEGSPQRQKNVVRKRPQETKSVNPNRILNRESTVEEHNHYSDNQMAELGKLWALNLHGLITNYTQVSERIKQKQNRNT